MNTFKCDRCGKYFDVKVPDSKLPHIVTVPDDNKCSFSTRHKMDLCPMCQAKLDYFMDNPDQGTAVAEEPKPEGFEGFLQKVRNAYAEFRK